MPQMQQLLQRRVVIKLRQGVQEADCASCPHFARTRGMLYVGENRTDCQPSLELHCIQEVKANLQKPAVYLCSGSYGAP